MRGHIKRLFLHICRALGLFMLARHRVRRKLLIFCYHGFQVCDESDFRPGLFITPERFQRRMSLIGKYNFSVLSLSEALEKMFSGKLPDNAATITIDDGFASTHSLAYPVLQSHGYPATVYVTTYYVNKDAPIFRLAVQYLFWKSDIGKADFREISWAPNQDLDLGDELTTERLMWQCIQYGEHECSEERRHELLAEMSELLKVNLSEIWDSRMLSLMNPAEISDLAKNGIDIQLHTHRHHFPAEDEGTARKEIEENIAVLGPITGHDLEHFCYPSGEWDIRQWDWLDSLKLQSATTCEPGYNDSDTHKFALKRFLDKEDLSEIEFLSEISGFSDILRRFRSFL